MPIALPPDEMFIDPAYFEEAAEIMRRADDFVPPDPNRKPPQYKMRYRGYKINAWKAIGAAASALAAGLILEMAISIADDVISRRRRKERGKACLDDCIDIVDRAQISLDEGYSENRALETKNEKRYERRFYSRA